MAASATGMGIAGTSDAPVGDRVLHLGADLPAGEGAYRLVVAHAALQGLLPAGPLRASRPPCCIAPR